jgi:hypothetical protein
MNRKFLKNELLNFINYLPFSVKIFIISDLILIAIITVFNLYSGIALKIYSLSIYPILAFVMGRITDIFIFSLTEILIILTIMVIMFRFIKGLYKIFSKKIKFKNVFLNFIKQSFIVISIILLWFYFMWGFNYFRSSIDLKMGASKKITDEYFEKAVDRIIEKSNALYTVRPYSLQMLNDKINYDINFTIKKISKKDISPAKKAKYSILKILENTNTLGVISPFLLESHLSGELSDLELPSIMAHEKSHLFGYADETEANLLAFIACTNSSDSYIQYSGYCDVLPYFLKSYRIKNSREKYKIIFDKVRPEIKNDYMKINKRFERHDTKFNKLLMNIYDLYLKANNVKQGTKAYSLVVELILKNNLLDL